MREFLKKAEFCLSEWRAHSVAGSERRVVVRRRGRKRKARGGAAAIMLPRIQTRRSSSATERRLKKRKFDPGPTMILQEEVCPLSRVLFSYFKMAAVVENVGMSLGRRHLQMPSLQKPGVQAHTGDAR